MLGNIFKKLFGGSDESPQTTTAPAAPKATASDLRLAAPKTPIPAAVVDRPGAFGTGVPDPDGATSGLRANGDYFIAHPFCVPLTEVFYEHWVNEEDLPWIPKPQPPAGLSQEDYDYAEEWFNMWEAAVEPQYAFHDQADHGGTLPEALRILGEWSESLEELRLKAAEYTTRESARALVLGNGDMHEAVDSYIEACKEYLEKSVEWEHLEFDEKIDTLIDSISGLLGFYVARNQALASFYADPTGEATRRGEEAHYAQYNAMRNVDESAPELQPISGVSLHDYVAGSEKLRSGASVDEIAGILGIERPQWDHAASEWQGRIGAHPMTVGVQYTNLISTPHPLLSGANTAGGNNSADNAARLSSDLNFYIEAAAAMNAASEAGLDVDGFLEERGLGVTLAQVGPAGVTWMSDFSRAGEIMDRVQARQKAIAKEINSGPGAADDIEF